MISVIIPAHNEESVIARSVRALTDATAVGKEGVEGVEVIVVCNGCTDKTAEAARSGGGANVIETDVASKVHALNLGDAAATGFPRFFVDADVVLPLADLRTMAALLAEGKCLAVAPRFRMELEGCSWAVRAFYDINGRLPSAREGIGGSGVYGLSEAGRRRFGKFPELTADDGFVRVQFTPQERMTVNECHSTVYAPKTVGELITIKTRSHFGSIQLRQRLPELWANKGPGNGAALKRLCLRPWLWPKLAAYGYVKMAARLRAQRRMESGNHAAWERDDSSRLTKPA